MSLVVLLFGKFCREAIGHQDVKISCNNLSIVFFLLSIRLWYVEVCQFRLRPCVGQLSGAVSYW